jgi:hypothetical protein
MDIQLIYTSIAAHNFTDEELDELLATSSSNNAIKKVTGMLLYGNGKFMQVLEGEADVVDAFLQKIVADRRHTKLNVLVRTPIKQRDFHSWSMGFRRTDRDCIGDLQNFSAFFDEDFDHNSACDTANLALAVLKSFAFPRDDGYNS